MQFEIVVKINKTTSNIDTIFKVWSNHNEEKFPWEKKKLMVFRRKNNIPHLT